MIKLNITNSKFEEYYQYIPAILIFIVGFILSFFRWATQDEVCYLKDTMIISEFIKIGQWFGNEDVGLHGFLFKIPVAIFYLITGPNIWVATIFNIILASVTAFIMHKVFYHFTKNDLYSMIAAILTVFSYYYISVLPTFLRDVPVMFSLLVFIYALIKEKPYWLLGLLFMLVLDAKEYIAVILTPVLFLWLLITEFQRNKFSLKFFGNILYKPILIFAPSVLYLYLMFFTSVVPVNYFTAAFLKITGTESNIAKVNLEKQFRSFGTDTSKLFSTIQIDSILEEDETKSKAEQDNYVKSLEPVKRSLALRAAQPIRTIAVKENENKSNIIAEKVNNSKQEKNNVKFYGRSEGRKQETGIGIQEVRERKNLESRKAESIKKTENKLITENRKTETRKESGIRNQELGSKEEQIAKTEKDKQVQVEKKRLEEQKVTGKTNEESRQSLITKKEEQKPVIERQNTENRISETKKELGIGNKEVSEKKNLESRKEESSKKEDIKQSLERTNAESRIAELGKNEEQKPTIKKKEEQFSNTEKEKQIQSEKKRLEEQKVTGKTNEESRQSLITKKEEQKPTIRRKEEQLSKTDKENQVQAEKKRLEEQKPVTEKQNIENRIAETRKELGIGNKELGKKVEKLAKANKERIDEQKNVIKKKEVQTEEKIRSTIQNTNKENNFEEDNSLSLIDTITGKKIGNISEEEDIENLKEEKFFKLKQSSDSLTRERSKFLNILESIGITILNVFIVYGQKILSPRTFSYMSFPLYLVIFSLFACISLLKKNYKRPDFLFVSIYLFIYLAVYLIRPSHARYLLHLVPIFSLYVVYFFIQGFDNYKKLLIPVLITLPLTAASLYFEITMPLIKILANVLFYFILFFIIYLLYKNRNELAKKVSIAFILLLSFFTFGSSIMQSYSQGQIIKSLIFGQNNEYKEIAKYFDKNKTYWFNSYREHILIQFYNKDINQGLLPWRLDDYTLKDWLPKYKMENKWNYIPNFYHHIGYNNPQIQAKYNTDYIALLYSKRQDIAVFPELKSDKMNQEVYLKFLQNPPEWLELDLEKQFKNKKLLIFKVKYSE